MTGEIIAIVTVGVALAGLILTSVHGLRGEIAALRADTQEQIAGLHGYEPCVRIRKSRLAGCAERS